MGKKKMTYEIYSQKKERLESRAKQLRTELAACEKKLKEVTEEIKKIDEEYILLSFRNSGKSVAEYTGITKIEATVTGKSNITPISSVQTNVQIAENNNTSYNKLYNTNYSGGSK